MTTDSVAPVKIIAPTVEQLNADHITQVTNNFNCVYYVIRQLFS